MKNKLPFYRQFFTEDLYVVKEKVREESEVADAPVTYDQESQEVANEELLVVLENLELKKNPTLLKLLSAIKHPDPDFSTTKDPHYKKCLVFGGGTDRKKYESVDESGVLTLYSDSLEVLEANKPLKHQLWSELQKMFL